MGVPHAHCGFPTLTSAFVPGNWHTSQFVVSAMIRQVDSSLIEEWERMSNPNFQASPDSPEVRPSGAEAFDADVTRDVKAFTAAIRNKIFTFLRGLVIGDFEQALTHLNTPLDADGAPWTPDRFGKTLDAYHVEHERICLEPHARNQRHTYVTPSEDKQRWRVQQMLIDPQEHNDWVAEFDVDLAQSRATSEPALSLRRLGDL